MKTEISALLICAIAGWSAHANAQGFFQKRECKALAQPFVGIAERGIPEQGLYSLRKTGVSTMPIQGRGAHQRSQGIGGMSIADCRETFNQFAAKQYMRPAPPELFN